LIVARYTITRWRLASTRILTAMLGVVVVLLLGSRLHIAGHPTISLPWKLLDHWLLRDVIPLRLAVYMFLIVAVIGAMWLAQPRVSGGLREGCPVPGPAAARPAESADAARLSRPSARGRGDRRSQNARAVADGARSARTQANLARRRVVLPCVTARCLLCN